MQDATLTLTVRAHWVNAALLLWAARPYVLVDDAEHECRWSEPLRLPVSAGDHRVAAFIRYKHTSATLGRGELDVHLDPGQTVNILARNGAMNQTPFHLRLVP